MNIRLNGQETEITADWTVADLLSNLQLPTEGVAVAVNRSVVPRSQFAEQRLTEGAQVEVLRAVGGG